MTTLQGKWIFTFQDCGLVRDLMAAWKIHAIERANGIGNNGKQHSGRTYREIIISSEVRPPTRQRKGRTA